MYEFGLMFIYVHALVSAIFFPSSFFSSNQTYPNWQNSDICLTWYGLI
jgi:hypothetical protein